MNKEVIYIDIEDDITALIGKVKAAASKIVALVPPKRSGSLQSAVNLKLLQKAALGADKRVVLITNDHSLLALAAGLKIPVAKNLQSRPEIPHMEAPAAPEEEIINGKDLPVGDVASSLTKQPPKDASVADDISEKVELPSVDTPPGEKQAPSAKLTLADKLRSKTGKLSVPNFDSFRKKVFIFGGLGVLLISFLVWALMFAPRATVTIKAKTTDVAIDRTLTLTPSLQASDTASFNLKPVTQQIKKSVAAEFDATGSKDIGNKAIGTIYIKNCDGPGFTLAAGTVFTASGGKKFASNAAVSVGALSGSASTCRNTGAGAGTGEVAVTAADLGPEYNVAAGTFAISGVSGDIYADSTDAMAGGTRETVTVVSQADVDKAKEQLSKPDQTAAKAELKKLFTSDQMVIEESFVTEEAAPASSPAVGEQAKRAKLTVETTFTYTGVARSDVKQILQAAMNEVLKDKADQQLYTLGENSVVFQVYQKADNGTATVRLGTTGSVGPKIDSGQLAKQLVGKRFGEIQAITNQIPGVDSVDIELSPFWVTTAPSVDKIEIKFSVSPNGK